MKELQCKESRRLTAIDLVELERVGNVESILFELLFRGARFSPNWQQTFPRAHSRILARLDRPDRLHVPKYYNKTFLWFLTFGGIFALEVLNILLL